MANYILLVRLGPDAVKDPSEFAAINDEVTKRLKTECPEANWLASFLTLGPFDYLDIFEAPDNETAAKVAVIIRAYVHGTTEVWPAVAWERFRRGTLRIVA